MMGLLEAQGKGIRGMHRVTTFLGSVYYTRACCFGPRGVIAAALEVPV